MTTSDLLTDQEKAILKQAYDSAKQMQDILTRLVGAGFPYNDHLTKANEQVEWLSKTIELFQIR